MAVTTISGPDSVSLALSVAYLGATAHVVGSNCDMLEVWIDDDGIIAGTIRFTLTGSNNSDAVIFPLAAGEHWTHYPGRGAAWTLDAKSAGGTPALSVVTGMQR